LLGEARCDDVAPGLFHVDGALKLRSGGTEFSPAPDETSPTKIVRANADIRVGFTSGWPCRMDVGRGASEGTVSQGSPGNFNPLRSTANPAALASPIGRSSTDDGARPADADEQDRPSTFTEAACRFVIRTRP
jgi:hypothetical protein